MIRRLLLAVGLLLCAPAAAGAATCAQAHTFITAETLTAAVLNANPSGEIACINNIDNLNIGAAGVFASQIIPTSSARATFGGQWGYTIGPGVASQVPLTLFGFAGQSVDLFAILLTNGGTKAVWVDSAGVLRTNQNPTFPGLSLSSASGSGPVLVTSIASGGLGSANPFARWSYAGGTIFDQYADGTGNIHMSVPALYSGSLIFETNGANARLTIANSGAATFTSSVAATSFSGSGAGLTSIPWSALPYQPVQSVAAGSTKISIGGTATNPTVDVVGASANTASTIVARDGSGAFSMGALTATSVTSTGVVTATAFQPTVDVAGTASGPSFAGSSAGAFIHAPSGGGALNVQNFNGGAGAPVNASAFNVQGSSASYGVGANLGGGALSGATTGAFSQTVSINGGGTAAAGDLGVARSTTSGLVNFGNYGHYIEYGINNAGAFSLGATGDLYLVSGTYRTGSASYGATGANINGALTGATTVNASGLGTFVGLTAGTGTSQGSSNGSTVAYHPPVYTAAGAATASTLHIVTGSVTVSGGATGSVTFSGAAVFANTSYAVAMFPTSSPATSTNYWVSAKTTTGFTATIGGSTNVTFDYIAIGV